MGRGVERLDGGGCFRHSGKLTTAPALIQCRKAGNGSTVLIPVFLRRCPCGEALSDWKIWWTH